MIDLCLRTNDFIKKHENANVTDLALKAHAYPDIDIAFAIQQIKGRQIAKNKIQLWYNTENIIYPPTLSLEQCSSEETAKYKQKLTIGKNIIDLTGGFGVDISYMSRNKERVLYVEQQKTLVDIARSNFKTLNLLNIETILADGQEYIVSSNEVWDTIYIDPARRDTKGRKTVLIEDCTPNLIELDEIFNKKSKQTIIKLSPMLDITQAINKLSNVTEVHIISVNNECKELLLIKSQSPSHLKYVCVNITKTQTHIFDFEKDRESKSYINHTDSVLKYLYEPNTSILKAGCFKYIATSFNINKLHTNSHLYTSDTLHTSFPGRIFEVQKTISPNKKEIKQNLNIKDANIAVRNYPFTVAELRKQTKLKDGGDNYIFATTLANEKKVLILCKKAI